MSTPVLKSPVPDLYAPGESTRWLNLSSAARGKLCLLLLSCPAAVAAYYGMFIGFSPYDDEGTFMMMVKEYLAGLKLYDQMYSNMGPFYFFYNWLIRFLSRTPVTHDVTRMTSVVVWLVCTVICAWIVLRLTKSLALASIAYVLAFGALAFFRAEPGHPQELCILLLLALIAAGTLLEKPRYRSVAMVALGAIPAALLLVKMNLGIFAGAAVALSILFQMPLGALALPVRLAASAASLAIPVVLMKVRLSDPPTAIYCFVVTASTAALLPGLFGAARSTVLSLRDCWIVVASFFATIAAAWLILLAQGVSSHSILYAQVFANFRLVNGHWALYAKLPLGWASIAWALGGLGAAIVFAWYAGREQRKAYELLAAARLMLGVGTVLLGTTFALGWGPLESGGGAMIAGFVTPYCWLLVYPTAVDTESSEVFPRILLATTAVLQTLYAYPVAGSQQAFVAVLLIIAGLVALGDFMAAAEGERFANAALLWMGPPALVSVLLGATLQQSLAVARSPQSLVWLWLIAVGALAIIDFLGAARRLPPRDGAQPWTRPRPVVVALLLSAVLYLSVYAYQAERQYQLLSSPRLAGAERVHMPAQQVRAYWWLVTNLQTYCDVFMGLPDILSLNFWTAKDPPTGLNAGFWLYGLDDKQQLQVAAALSKYPNACIVYAPSLLDSRVASGADISSSPLAQYLTRNFKSIGSRDGYFFWVRNERDLSSRDVLR